MTTKLYQCGHPDCPGWPWRPETMPHPCGNEAPVGVRYHLPRKVAVRHHHSHYGLGFYPLSHEDLASLDVELRTWLVTRKKQDPVILDGMPSPDTIIAAMKAEKLRLDTARDDLLARQRRDIQEILDGAPESLWEIAACNAQATSGDVAVNYPEYYVRPLLQLKEDIGEDFRGGPVANVEEEIDQLKYHLMVHWHIETSPEIAQAMQDHQAHHAELCKQVELWTLEAYEKAKAKAEAKAKAQHERETAYQHGIEVLLDWAKEKDRRVRLGLEGGFDMEKAAIERLEAELLIYWMTDEYWSVLQEEVENVTHQESPSLDALLLRKNIEEDIKNGPRDDWTWPWEVMDLKVLGIKRVAALKPGERPRRLTKRERWDGHQRQLYWWEAVELDYRIPEVYAGSLYLLLKKGGEEDEAL